MHEKAEEFREAGGELYVPFVVQLTTSHRHHAPAKCQVDSLLRPRSVESIGASPGATRYLFLVRLRSSGPAPGRTWTAPDRLSGGQEQA